MRKRNICLLLTLLLCVSLAFSGCGGESGNPDDVKLDPANPVTISVWNYYNGAQLDAFNALVDEYNETEGKERGILVEGFSQGAVKDLEASVLDSANKVVGASPMPNIFAAYADTAYAVDQMELLVDLTPYFTKDELEEFIPSYIEEGRFAGSDALKIFPIAKSTEVFLLNKTDWNEFSGATGWEVSELSTIEGVTRTAKAYYEWTDSLTEQANDGRAFFGRDAMANYMLIGSMELGQEIFAAEDGKTVLHFEKDAVRRLWENYYVPFVRGYFAASGRFRSGDIKTGDIISFVGSSSGATFFPDKVVRSDDNIYPIEMDVMPGPHFEGGKPYAVQQGAGMVVTKGTKEEIYASVQFLKWFTSVERNTQFSIASGYLPVKQASNDMKVIEEQIGDTTDVMKKILNTAIDTVNSNDLYTPKAFESGTDARNILEYSLSDKAQADRAAVVQSLQSGASLEEACGPFETEENFDRWYEDTKAQLESLVK